MSKREIRDPIHGFIHLKEEEFAIIDKPIFQRLRRIKQLALANIVYPGAMHTRFDHSIGTMHVADSMAKALELSDEEIGWVRKTALLHDLGHGPFSHVSENLLAKFAKKEIIKDQGLEQIHELITIQLIKNIQELGNTDRERIIGILLTEDHDIRERMLGFLDVKDKPPSQLMKNIISGPLDADKQDYLLRDSYFCGVEYGVFDIDRLHNTLEKNDDIKEGLDLSISEDGIHAVEQYVMAKYYMNTQVYRHRVRLATDAMITRAMELGIEKDKISFLKDLYEYDGSDDFLKNYTEWDDERVSREILNRGKGKAFEIFKDLAERKLLKQIYHKNLQELDAPMRNALIDLQPDDKKKLEESIGEKLGFDHDLLYIYVYKIKSVRSQVKDTEGSIKVKNRGLFHEESNLFNSIKDAMDVTYVEIYGPAHYSTEEDKHKKLNDWNDKIKEIFEETLGRK